MDFALVHPLMIEWGGQLLRWLHVITGIAAMEPEERAALLAWLCDGH
jgi:hypothetical protein